MLSSTHVRNAPPAIYATFDGSDRPMLPLMNLPFQWKAPIIIGYLTMLWLWQGAVLPIPWETEETLLNSTDRIVQPYRLPNGFFRMTNPELWTEDEIMIFQNHIYDGQRRICSNLQIFQFYVMGEGHVDSELRLTPYPSPDPYILGFASRMYMVRLLRREEDDPTAVDELLFQFPPLSEGNSAAQEWSLDELMELKLRCLGNSRVKCLAKEYVLFEQSQPLHASRARWQMYGGDCSQMKVACPVSSFFIEVLGGWWLPPSFFLRARTRKTIGNQTDFLMRDDWYDLLTGTLYGGPYGIRWMVLLLIRSFWTLSMVDNAEAPDKPSYVRSDAFTLHDLEHVLLDINYLTEEMQLGIKRIHNIRDLHESHEHQQIGLIDMEFFRVRWAPDPPVVEPEEEPLPYSPGQLQSILKDKPKGKAKKGKCKVVILLPAPKATRSPIASQQSSRQGPGPGTTAHVSTPPPSTQETSKRKRIPGSGSSVSSSHSPRKTRARAGRKATRR